MKRLFLIVLALMTAIILTACGGNGDAVTTGDVSEDITPSELPVTVASEDVTDVVPEETEATEETEAAVTTAPESDETEATTTTASEATTAATTTTATTTTASTTTKSTTTATTTTAATTTVDEDEEEVEILFEEGVDRDEFEAMFGIDSGDGLDVNG